MNCLQLGSVSRQLIADTKNLVLHNDPLHRNNFKYKQLPINRSLKDMKEEDGAYHTQPQELNINSTKSYKRPSLPCTS